MAQKASDQQMEEPKRLRIDQLQKLLEEKLRALIEGVRGK